MGLVLLLGSAVPLVWAGKVEWDRAEVLRRLQKNGHQVRAADVQMHERGKSVLGTIHVRYRFLPLERHEIEPTKIDDPTTGPIDMNQVAKQVEELKRWAEVERNNPWIWAQGSISSDVRDAITMRGERMVTYLPEMPEVNCIGPLTDERISKEWRSNPTFVVIPLIWLAALGTAWLSSSRRNCSAQAERSSPLTITKL